MIDPVDQPRARFVSHPRLKLCSLRNRIDEESQDPPHRLGRLRVALPIEICVQFLIHRVPALENPTSSFPRQSNYILGA